MFMSIYKLSVFLMVPVNAVPVGLLATPSEMLHTSSGLTNGCSNPVLAALRVI